MSNTTRTGTDRLQMALQSRALALLAAVLFCLGPRTSSAASALIEEEVAVPWRAGNAALFQAGTREEGGAQSAQGMLPVRLYRPPGAGPFPFVVLLHGCGGLRQKAMRQHWVRPWVALLVQNGIAAAVMDSFTPRGVDQVCAGNVAAWAVRRADDAYSVHAWLAAQPFADARRIAVMGMSNGGRTVLAALRTTPTRPGSFAAGVALYPGCQSDLDSRFSAPLLVLIGRADTVTPAVYCETMLSRQPADGAPTPDLVVYPRAPHTFDMRLPDRTILGMRLGHDAGAAADARQRVIAFLAANGVPSPNRAR